MSDKPDMETVAWLHCKEGRVDVAHSKAGRGADMTDLAELMRLADDFADAYGDWLAAEVADDQLLNEKRKWRTRAALETRIAEALDRVRREALEAAQNRILSFIKPGDLGGNGRDMNAQRNGMILAANEIGAMFARKSEAPIPPQAERSIG